MYYKRNAGFEGFAQRLRKVLKENKMSQVQTAQYLGISKHSFTKYMNGRIPETSILFALSKFFNKSMEWFLTGRSEQVMFRESSFGKIDKDITVEQMCEILKELMSNPDPNLRGWTMVQFIKAFGEYCPVDSSSNKKEEVHYTLKK
ncbi:helix-turn-helix domain-containing protein [Selenomonadales bacterium OttesenSCG-928-I06]|nr:helix-turn-helix domain-containing protein [Selenomonadales bacterium OttesenSCG-928-I06]